MDVFGFLTLTYLSRARILFHMSHQCLTGFGFISCSTGGIHQYIRAHLGGDSPNSFSPLSTFLTRLLREILSHCCRLALVSRTFQLYFFTYTTSPRIHAYVDEARYDAPFTSVTSLVHFCSRITQTPRNGVPKAYTWRKLRADAGTLIMEQKSGCE